MNGIILLDKSSGISSAKAIAQVKARLGADKIGHAGTLDPAATGLLVCLIGNATRLASLVESGGKRYSGTIRFGVKTSSDDLDGEILEESSADLSLVDLSGLAREFVGKIDQIPPKISAIKIAGQRSYQLARRGEEFALKPRSVELHSLELKLLSNDRVGFSLSCSKGFYVRALARDLGEKLGCGAALESLRREASFPFEVSKAKTLDLLSSEDLISVSALFPDTQRLHLESQLAHALYHGSERALSMCPAFPSVGVPLHSDFLYFDQKDLSRPLGVLSYSDQSWKIALNL